MSWIIVSDSACDLHTWEDLAPDTEFVTVPLKIRMGSREFIDNSALDVPQMMRESANYNGRSTTACPGPEEWLEQFRKADHVFAITITSGLSGSYNSACAARDMLLEEYPDKNICVIDSLSTGAEMLLIIREINRLIAEGKTFEEIAPAAQKCADDRHLLFMLASYENLVKNGRMSPLVGFVAGKLNMRCVGRASEKGDLDVFFKTRGETRALARILEELDQTGYNAELPIYIGHCQNAQAAELLKHGILTRWPNAEVHVYHTGGLCSFYVQDKGIILGY